MRLSHIHLQVRDLPSALAWLDRVWWASPTFHNERMAVVPFGSFLLIWDASDQDSAATIGFASDDCNSDYQRVLARGAVSIDEPRDRPWGARAAYIQGPGALKFEIEQPLITAPEEKAPV